MCAAQLLDSQPKQWLPLSQGPPGANHSGIRDRNVSCPRSPVGAGLSVSLSLSPLLHPAPFHLSSLSPFPSPSNFLLPSSVVCFKCSLCFGHYWMLLHWHLPGLKRTQFRRGQGLQFWSISRWFKPLNLDGKPLACLISLSCTVFCLVTGSLCVTQPSWAPTILLSQPPERDSKLCHLARLNSYLYIMLNTI